MVYNVEQLRKDVKKLIPEGLVVPEHTKDKHYYRHTGVDERYSSVTTITGIIDKPELKPYVARVTTESAIEAIKDLKPGSVLPMVELKQSQNKHVELLEDAGNLGTKVHDAAEEYAKGLIKGEDNFQKLFDTLDDPRAKSCFRAVKKFFNDHHVIPIIPEQKVASTQRKYAGTVDLVALVGFVKKPGRRLEHGEEYFWGRASITNPNLWRCSNTGREVLHKLCIVDYKTSNTIDKFEYGTQPVAYGDAIIEMLGGLIKKFDSHVVIQLDKNKPNYKPFVVSDVPLMRRTFRHLLKMYNLLLDVKYKQTFDPLVQRKKHEIGGIKLSGGKEII